MPRRKSRRRVIVGKEKNSAVNYSIKLFHACHCLTVFSRICVCRIFFAKFSEHSGSNGTQVQDLVRRTEVVRHVPTTRVEAQQK